jgi:hypothetical protein
MRAGRVVASVASGLALAVALASGAPAGASDSSTAKKLVITKADAGRGFVAEPAPDEVDTFTEIAQCVGKPNPGRTTVAHAAGPLLVDERNAVSITSTVDIVKTAKTAKADQAIVEDLHFPDCFAEVLDRASGYGTLVDSQRVKLGRYGDYSAALLSRVESSRAGESAGLSVVTVLVRQGRAELLTQFATEGTTPFPKASVEKILDKVATRLDAADV